MNSLEETPHDRHVLLNRRNSWQALSYPRDLANPMTRIKYGVKLAGIQNVMSALYKEAVARLQRRQSQVSSAGTKLTTSRLVTSVVRTNWGLRNQSTCYAEVEEEEKQE